MLFNIILKCRSLMTSPKITTCETHREMLEFYSAIHEGLKA